MSELTKIIFLSPYPHNTAPSQRFRFEQYFQFLNTDNYLFNQVSFLDKTTWDILYKEGAVAKKIIGLLKGIINRIILLFSLPKYDFVFIHREASPVGPPIFEWIIAKILRKKIIYDFDDAIWMAQKGQSSGLLSFFKWHSKVSLICKWSYKVTCGNQFLADYALKFNNNVIVLPTTVDTLNVHNHLKNHEDNREVVVGWTGSHSTLVFLETIIPILKKVQLETNFSFIVISNKPPSFKINNLEFVKWSEISEIDDLLRIDIGLMPTENSEWGKGKCGFKAIQYMSLGIPTIASYEGANSSIITHGVDGYLCENKEDWKTYLLKLISTNLEDRIELGKAARKKIIDSFSSESQKDKFIKLFS